jgi:hypothetical protein
MGTMGGIRGVGGTEGERGGKAGGWTSGKQLAVAHVNRIFFLSSFKQKLYVANTGCRTAAHGQSLRVEGVGAKIFCDVIHRLL